MNMVVAKSRFYRYDCYNILSSLKTIYIIYNKNFWDVNNKYTYKYGNQLMLKNIYIFIKIIQAT